MMWTKEVHISAQPVSIQAGQPALSLHTTLSTLFYAILESLQDWRVKCEPIEGQLDVYSLSSAAAAFSSA